MATVQALLRGGPADGQIRTLDVADSSNPPEVHTIQLHGPHEIAQCFRYRRVGRKPDGEEWIYEFSD
jgi:hypothetical protein